VNFLVRIFLGQRWSAWFIFLWFQHHTIPFNFSHFACHDNPSSMYFFSNFKRHSLADPPHAFALVALDVLDHGRVEVSSLDQKLAADVVAAPAEGLHDLIDPACESVLAAVPAVAVPQHSDPVHRGSGELWLAPRAFEINLLDFQYATGTNRVAHLSALLFIEHL
jgi:hypothetical protein